MPIFAKRINSLKLQFAVTYLVRGKPGCSYLQPNLKTKLACTHNFSNAVKTVTKATFLTVLCGEVFIVLCNTQTNNSWKHWLFMVRSSRERELAIRPPGKLESRMADQNTCFASVDEDCGNQRRKLPFPLRNRNWKLNAFTVFGRRNNWSAMFGLLSLSRYSFYKE